MDPALTKDMPSLAYADNYLIDLKVAIIVDVEGDATPRCGSCGIPARSLALNSRPFVQRQFSAGDR